MSVDSEVITTDNYLTRRNKVWHKTLHIKTSFIYMEGNKLMCLNDCKELTLKYCYKRLLSTQEARELFKNPEVKKDEDVEVSFLRFLGSCLL